MDDFAGAAMASVSHALSNRFSLVYFASSLDIPHLTANVSVHPLLDSDYGSTGLQIRHDGMQHSQLDKVRLLADWDVAPHALRSRAFRKRLAWDEERDWKGVIKSLIANAWAVPCTNRIAERLVNCLTQLTTEGRSRYRIEGFRTYQDGQPGTPGCDCDLGR
jgi:hypothetical protein